MPYRVWHYVCKLFAIPMIAGMLVVVLVGIPRAIVGSVITSIFLCLGIIGGLMGVLMTLGKLKMRCPFCGRSGKAWGSRDEGLRMECPKCGLIWSGGRFGLEMYRERTPDDSEERHGSTAE